MKKNNSSILVFTGDGKGKSSAAFGTVMRSLGFNKKCAVIQFIKNNGKTSESSFFSTVPNISFHSMGKGFTWESKNLEEDKMAAQNALQKAITYLKDPEYWTVMLDEVTYAVNYNFIELQELLTAINDRSDGTNVIITGRECPQAIIDISDYATEMVKIKHPFDNNQKAIKGIDF